MRITEIRYISKNKADIYIDYEKAFFLYKSEINKNNIKEDYEISKEDYEYILNDIILKRAKKKALNLLIKMDRTENEIRSKLKNHGYTEETINKTIDYINSYNYINDENYTRNYINYKKDSLSKQQIGFNLKNKGISKEVMDEIFSEIYSNEEDDPEIIGINKLISKRVKYIKELTNEDKQKLISYIYRKGYNIDKIKKAIECHEKSEIDQNKLC